MRAVADLLGRGDFLLPTKVKTATARYARAIDSVRSWIQDECRVGEGYTIDKKGAYIQYGRYCRDNNDRAMPREWIETTRTVIDAGR